ncbi:putative D,D-dipeptide transport ATP-binding protein DdpD [Paenibacillus konkukensis]|uniref:D,D-dipeptide transport ATP-binding protein DdpD n=1 Tax=Paenibacillus konkukensis TaxID=2020716 RepID=A0ABY4REH1_9BACL|nr:ABC transporter ATP-binding protein [Paenibacillus konkukensis]UQZ81076.1 putative D,D-dipeptide transport ATP-binding protein DdpD [Paenibacillus konkukensis]
MDKHIVLSVDHLHISVSTPHGMKKIVNDVSFRLNRGEVLGLVGASGSGKTMTCLAIMGLLQESAIIEEGSILLEGKNLLQATPAQMRSIRGGRLAVVMQNPMSAFNPTVTIGSHFMETLRAQRSLSRAEARELAETYLGKTGLPRPAEIMKQYPFQLSGGMLQRAMIAIAMSLQPAVLIADEPTTALDTVHQMRLLEQMRRLCEEQETAMLLVSHDLGVIAYMADEVMVMQEGSIVEKAPVARLFDRPEHPYTRMLLEARPGIGLV